MENQNALINSLLKYQMVKYTATTQRVKHYPHAYGKKYDEVAGDVFLNMVKVPTKNKFYATYYDTEDLVKPFFDFDLDIKIGTERWCNKQKKTALFKLLDNLVDEFWEEGEIVRFGISDNSRINQKSGMYKISFHIIVNCDVYCKVKDLKKIAYAYDCDTKVYKGKRILRFSNQYKDVNVEEAPTLCCIEVEEKDERGRVETDLSMFLINKTPLQKTEHVSSLPELAVIERKKKFKRGINNSSPVKTDPNYIPHKTQMDTIKQMLGDFPNDYLEDYEKWRDLGFILCNYSCSKKMFDLFEDFTKKNYKKYAEGKSKRDCKTLWFHAQKGHCERPKTMGSLIEIHRKLLTFIKEKKRDKSKTKSLTKENKKIIDDQYLKEFNTKIKEAKAKGLIPIFKPKKQIIYSKLHKPIKYDCWEGLDFLLAKDLERLDISSKFITNIDGSPIEAIAEKLNQHKILFIKSPTGSGKTCLIQHRTKGENVVSVVSRRSLATFHHKNLDSIYLHYAKKPDMFNGTMGKVYQLDSLYEKGYNWKLHNDMIKKGLDPKDNMMYLRKDIYNFDLDEVAIYQGDYILILDEFNSLINHIFSPHNMRTKRLEITQNLIRLVENAKQVLCFDADLSKPTLQWIYENVNTQTEKPLLIVNTPKIKRETPITFYKDPRKMIMKMREDIKNNVKFFCCSDRCKQFFKDVVLELIDKDKKDGIEALFLSQQDKPLIRTGKFLVYSGFKMKQNDEEVIKEIPEINTEDWKDKWVFTTPTIIYGIDYNYPKTHKIYSLNYGGTISALGINQQIGRIRQPISIDIFVEDMYYVVFWSWEHFLHTFTTLKNNNLDMEIKMSEYLKKVGKGYLEKLNRLHQYYRYTEDYLKTHIVYHLTNLLKGKGYVNISTDEDILDGKRRRKDNVELIKYLKDNDIDTTQQLTELVKRFNWCDLRDTLKKVGLSLDEVMIDKTRYREFLNIGLLRWKYNLYKVKDTMVNKILSDKYKVQLFIDVMKKMGMEYPYEWIPEKFKQECDEEHKITDKDMISKIKLSYKIKVFDGQLYAQVFSKMCKQMLPTFSISGRWGKERKNGCVISEHIIPLFNEVVDEEPPEEPDDAPPHFINNLIKDE